MFVRNLSDCNEFIAGDNTILRELFNPLKDDISADYSLAHAKVPPGKTTFSHKLKSTEVYYILEGEGIMYIDREEQKVGPGDAIHIPPNSLQCIKNIGSEELVFICMVNPPWKKEDEEVL